MKWSTRWFSKIPTFSQDEIDFLRVFVDQLKKFLRFSFRSHLLSMPVLTFIKVKKQPRKLLRVNFFKVSIDFGQTYSTTACQHQDLYWERRKKNQTNVLNMTNESWNGKSTDNKSSFSLIRFFFVEPCARDSSLLYLLLSFGTVWLGTFLYKFKQTPYLTSAKREWLTDYALPVSVIILSLTGSVLFSQINRNRSISLTLNHRMKFIWFYLVHSFSVDRGHLFVLVRFHSISLRQIIGTGILGFSLSLLMFLVKKNKFIWNETKENEKENLLGSKHCWCHRQFTCKQVQQGVEIVFKHISNRCLDWKKAKRFMSICSSLPFSTVGSRYLD